MDDVRELVPVLPAAIVGAVYMAVRVLLVVTAVFGRDRHAQRALMVLRLMRRDKQGGVHDGRS